MSETKIPPKVGLELWVKSGGRCQYEGCNEHLLIDPVTLSRVNRAYKAHIVADSTLGPRGDELLSAALAKDVNNIMLLCDTHHRLVDREQVAEHPPERLRQMKREHETRIAIVTSIQAEKKTEILLYGARVGDQHVHVNWNRAAQVIVPDRYPLSMEGIELSLKQSPFADREPAYWTIEAEQLKRQYVEKVKHRQAEGRVQHLSVFALAPQPLLILLGSLLTDISAVDVFQLHREPQDWRWQKHLEGFDYILETPDSEGVPALVFALSADIASERIHNVLGPSTSIWRVTIPKPDNDFLKSRQQLHRFRQLMREVMNRIKQSHGQAEILHVFPAMPVATAVEFGRILMPKADLPLRIYDENGGFAPALDINVPVAI